jgi:hypothetical protein
LWRCEYDTAQYIRDTVFGIWRDNGVTNLTCPECHIYASDFASSVDGDLPDMFYCYIQGIAWHAPTVSDDSQAFVEFCRKVKERYA